MFKINNKDKQILRELAKKVAQYANSEEMLNREKLHTDINSLKNERPVVLCFPEGSWTEIIPGNTLECEDKFARALEFNLKSIIFTFEEIKDDNLFKPYVSIPWDVDLGDYGVKEEYIHGENRGSFVWVPPIKDLEKDFEKLKFREIKFNEKKTYETLELAKEVFQDILDVNIRGSFIWSLGLAREVIRLVGLEEFMIYLYDEPENLHRLMEFLGKERMNFITELEKSGHLTQNNKSDYVGSGGFGYTNLLKDVENVTLKDMWGFCESQETVGVSPEMFNEFVFQYELPLLEKYGLNCYGCCEVIEDRWKYIKKIPNLRRVSISPWSNIQKASDILGKDYIFSRKPNPTMICQGFDEEYIRKEIRKTLDITKNNVVEIIMKDTHTVQGDISRFGRFTKIVREEIENS